MPRPGSLYILDSGGNDVGPVRRRLPLEDEGRGEGQ